MISAIWTIVLSVLGILVFIQKNKSFGELRDGIKNALLHPTQKDSWMLLGFLFFLLLFPLVAGLDFYLKSDANVLIVLIFFVWDYQWIKIIWNGDLERE